MSQHSSSELTLRDLLIVEDDPALVDFRCHATELPLWPQVRVALFRMMMSDLLYGVRLTGASNAAKSWTKAATTMVRSVAHNMQQQRIHGVRATLCITAEGVADQWIEGQWFNRLSDHFVSLNPEDSLVLADHFEWRWPFPRRHDRLMLHAPWQATNAVLGRIRVSSVHERQASELIKLVTDRALQHLGWILDAQRFNALAHMLARKAASMPWQYGAYTKLLSRIRPKLLMVGAGCYGPSACLIAAAKSLGIHTAEYQHGAISAGHDAYNFAPSIRESTVYQRTLPDHFLGYGEWWIEQINSPIKKWAIGNPHREERLGKLNAQALDQKNILILSDGIEFNLYLNLARNLGKRAKSLGLRIVLRPHPLERTRAMQMTDLDGIQIDTNADIYQSFKTAHTVVSEVSTGLFEAVGIAKNILIWDTPKSRFGYPNHPFKTFQSADSLIDILGQADCTTHKNPIESERIWRKNWKSNFQRFLADQGLN